MCMSFCQYIFHPVHVWYPEAEENMGSIGAKIEEDYEPPCGCYKYKLNPDPLQGQQVLCNHWASSLAQTPANYLAHQISFGITCKKEYVCYVFFISLVTRMRLLS